VRVPQLGLAFAVEPRLSIGVRDEGQSVIELRFESVVLPLPFGSVDIAGFLEPMRYPADSVFLLDGAQGDVQVRSRLASVKMGRERLRFEVTLEVEPTSP
jgi:hypothetical protein